MGRKGDEPPWPGSAEPGPDCPPLVHCSALQTQGGVKKQVAQLPRMDGPSGPSKN